MVQFLYVHFSTPCWVLSTCYPFSYTWAYWCMSRNRGKEIPLPFWLVMVHSENQCSFRICVWKDLIWVCAIFSLSFFFCSVFCRTSGELGCHNRNRLQESPAAIWCPVLCDCRLWQIERAQFIKMMLYRLVFLKGFTMHLGRENDSTTHCRLMWLAD